MQKNDKICFEHFPQKLYVYPAGKSSLIPFEIIPGQESVFYKRVEKDNTQLIFLLDGVFVENVQVHTFQNATLELSRRQAAFKTKTAKKILTLPQESCKFKWGEFHHICYLVFSSQSEQTLVCFNAKTAGLRLFHGQAIEITKDGFFISSPIQRKTLIVDSVGLKEKEVSSLGGEVSSNPFLIPSAFMECIKDKNYSRALTFLSPSLAKDEASIKGFFKEVSFVFTIDPKNIFAISNGQGKIFSFELSEGKIIDITD